MWKNTSKKPVKRVKAIAKQKVFTMAFYFARTCYTNPCFNVLAFVLRMRK